MTLVLLTGASGFLGSHVLQRLLEQNHQVRAFVRAPEKLRENLGLLGLDANDSRIEVATGNMTDPVAVREAASGCSHAIHAAATFYFLKLRQKKKLQVQ